MSDDAYPIPPALRYRAPFPPPRDVEVMGEPSHHCPPGCPHLAECYRKGFEEGARAEEKRLEHSCVRVGFAVSLSFLLGVLAASLVRLVIAAMETKG